MAHPVIEADDCSACGICIDVCPEGVLDIIDDAAEVIDEDSCIACGNCMEDFPMGCIVEIVED